MNGTPRIFLGYDIGGTKIGIGLGDETGKLYGTARIENRNTRPEVILPQLASEAKRLVTEAGLKMSDVAAFAVSSPSPADISNGIITAPPNNPYWRNVPIRDVLSKELGIRGFFCNDANAGALAEWLFGAGRGTANMIYLTMSTGIGGGIIAENTLINGKSFLAGEIGHTVMVPNGRPCNCGMIGCYEAYCGGLALANRMKADLANDPASPMLEFCRDGKLENVDMLSLEKATRAGVPYAIKLWDEMCFRNAWIFGTLINVFNPEKLVLGTIAWAAGDLFFDPVRKYLPQFAWKETLKDCEIVPSALKREIGSYAGIAAAIYSLDRA